MYACASPIPTTIASQPINWAAINVDNKYRDIAQTLIDDHGYAQNLMVPKIQRGIGTGNQSDDEMAFMCFYSLIKYETDPELKSRYALAFWSYWRLELPELNPFFRVATSFETPTFSSAVSMVKGKVALEEDVENARSGTAATVL